MQMIFPEQVKLLNSDFDDFKFERDFFFKFLDEENSEIFVLIFPPNCMENTIAL